MDQCTPAALPIGSGLLYVIGGTQGGQTVSELRAAVPADKDALSDWRRQRTRGGEVLARGGQFPPEADSLHPGQV